MVFEAGGLGVGKRLLGAVKKAADQRKRTSNQGSVEELKSFKRKELPKSVSIRSKESTPSKRQPPRTKPGTERKTQEDYLKAYRKGDYLNSSKYLQELINLKQSLASYAEIMKERIKIYKLKGFPKNWNGVFIATEK